MKDYLKPQKLEKIYKYNTRARAKSLLSLKSTQNENSESKITEKKLKADRPPLSDINNVLQSGVSNNTKETHKSSIIVKPNSDSVNIQQNITLQNSILEPKLPSIDFIKDGIPCSRRKTLKRQLYKPSEERGIVDLDGRVVRVSTSILYTPYKEDIIRFILLKEKKYIVKNTFVDSVLRAAVVNWLIKLQEYTGSAPEVLHMTVRLLDRLTETKEIPTDLFQLAGLALFWISSKYSDIQNLKESISAKKLIACCNNFYTNKQLFHVEKLVLKYLRFELCVEDSLLFIRYYIAVMKLENANFVSLCANYILDCWLLDPLCNSVCISVQSAAICHLTLKILNINLDYWRLLEKKPGYYPPEQLYLLQQRLLRNVRKLEHPNYEFREPFLKYSSEKYASISSKVASVSKDIKMI